MSNTIISPNMDLPIPVPGVDPGPDWANNLNACLGLIDLHDHSSGKGVPVTPAGLNINADLPFNSHNLTGIRSARLAINGSALSLGTDLNCIYDVSGDLYFNDGLGNQIRITQNGSIAGTAGSITGMTPPAYVSYNVGTQTFTFGSNSTTPANIDTGFINLRNNVSNSHKLQLLPPPGMASDIEETLPVPPSQLSVMTMNSAGAMGAQLVTQDLLAARTNGSVVGVGGVGISNSSGTFTTTSTSAAAVTNLAVTLTTTGRPVQVQLQPVLTSGTVDVNTVLLIHCDGSSGSTTFTDVSASAHTVTSASSAQVSNSQVKFGTGSLALAAAAANHLVVTGTESDWAFGTGDFTIDFWINSNAAPAGTAGLMSNVTGSGGADTVWRLRYNGGSGNFDFTGNSSLFASFGTGTINSSPFNIWHHIAIVRSSGQLFCFVDGTLLSSPACTANFSASNDLWIGTNNITNEQVSINGFLDEIRISNIARWTTNFTPPIAPYGSGSAPSSLGVSAAGAAAQSTFTLYRDGSALVPVFLESADSSGADMNIQVPPGSFNYLDPVNAGTYTYALYAQVSGSATANVTDCQLIAYEI